MSCGGRPHRHPELIELVRAPVQDPIAEAERRESLRRLVDDVRRLPEQQRSALLMRELAGMSYAELAAALVCLDPGDQVVARAGPRELGRRSRGPGYRLFGDPR